MAFISAVLPVSSLKDRTSRMLGKKGNLSNLLILLNTPHIPCSASMLVSELIAIRKDTSNFNLHASTIVPAHHSPYKPALDLKCATESQTALVKVARLPSYVLHTANMGIWPAMVLTSTGIYSSGTISKQNGGRWQSFGVWKRGTWTW